MEVLYCIPMALWYEFILFYSNLSCWDDIDTMTWSTNLHRNVVIKIQILFFDGWWQDLNTGTNLAKCNHATIYLAATTFLRTLGFPTSQSFWPVGNRNAQLNVNSRHVWSNMKSGQPYITRTVSYDQPVATTCSTSDTTLVFNLSGFQKHVSPQILRRTAFLWKYTSFKTQKMTDLIALMLSQPCNATNWKLL